jgi:predicted GNAT family acetyltransferase
VAELRVALLGEDADPTVSDLAEQLVERDAKVGDLLRDRWYAARADGELAGACRLMQGDGLGQVEDVATLKVARNRGIARAVVLAAVQASVDDGDDATFIVADADDWPRQLYERLGFDEVGNADLFRKKPPSASAGDRE